MELAIATTTKTTWSNGPSRKQNVLGNFFKTTITSRSPGRSPRAWLLTLPSGAYTVARTIKKEEGTTSDKGREGSLSNERKGPLFDLVHCKEMHVKRILSSHAMLKGSQHCKNDETKSSTARLMILSAWEQSLMFYHQNHEGGSVGTTLEYLPKLLRRVCEQCENEKSCLTEKVLLMFRKTTSHDNNTPPSGQHSQ